MKKAVFSALLVVFGVLIAQAGFEPGKGVPPSGGVFTGRITIGEQIIDPNFISATSIMDIQALRFQNGTEQINAAITSSNVIRVSDTLQFGATFYVSSGTVDRVSLFGGTITADTGKYRIVHVSSIVGGSPLGIDNIRLLRFSDNSLQESAGQKADNMGSHIATQSLNMGGFSISTVNSIESTSAVLSGNLTVEGNSSLKGLVVIGTPTAFNRLQVDGGALFNRTVNISSQTTIGTGTTLQILLVKGLSSFEDQIIVGTQPFGLPDRTTFITNGSGFFSDTLILSTAATDNLQKLIVNGDTDMNGNLTIGEVGSTNDQVNIDGGVAMKGAFLVENSTNSGQSTIAIRNSSSAIGALILFENNITPAEGNDFSIGLTASSYPDFPNTAFLSVTSTGGFRIESEGSDINIVPKSSVSIVGVLEISSRVTIGSQVAFSSVPVMHVGGFNSTLGSGATFFAFTPDSAIRLRRITVTIVVSGTGGTGDVWVCGDGVNQLTVTSAAGARAGSRATATGSASISAGTAVLGRLQSNAVTTPTANLICEYVMQ